MNISIVVGIGSYNDIGIIRSCGEVGINSIYINTNRFDLVPIWKSKYIKEFLYIDNEIDIIDFIRQRAKSEPHNQFFLFGASDASTLLFDRNFDRLPSNVICQHANGRLEELMDKDVMGRMATESGLIIPKSRKINLNNQPSISVLPVILKPLESVKGHKSDITVCYTETEFIKALEDLKNKGYTSILEQQYIHSPDSKEIGITGVSYPNGLVEFFGFIHKIRNRSNINNFGKYYPKQTIECSEALKNFVKSTGYIGIFDTDFILDNNTMYFIECNFRNGAYGYSVTSAGYNMPEHFISGQALLTAGTLRDITFMEERTDLLNVLDKSISPFRWLRDLVSTDTFLWWNRHDPKIILRVPYGIKKLFAYINPNSLMNNSLTPPPDNILEFTTLRCAV